MHSVHLVNTGDSQPDPRGGTPDTKALLVVEDLVKRYHVGGGDVTALRQVTLTVGDGDVIAIRGRSGAGKTTLLNLIAGLDDPTDGRVILFGRDLAHLSECLLTDTASTE